MIIHFFTRYFAIPLLFLVSLLPWFVLYAISNFIAFLLIYVFKYRKHIIDANLHASFPEWSYLEIKNLRNNYYKHLADIMVESIKGWSISKKELLKRYTMPNTMVLDKLKEQNKGIMVIMTHKNNWEWSIMAAPLVLKIPILGVYKTLSNKAMDSFMKGRRTRFGSRAYPMEQIFFALREQKETPFVTAFISDQNPASTKNAHWHTFLNQETPFLTGTATIARKLNLAVISTFIVKKRRGYYELDCKVICENAAELSTDEIMKLSIQFMEEDIKQQPETWLWSHRRWKHKKTTNSIEHKQLLL